MPQQPQPQSHQTQQPQEKRIKLDGVTLTYFEWGQPGNEVFLFNHATGFHARCWDRVILKLQELQAVCNRPFHAIAVDQRGHGRSDKKPPYTWGQYGQDLIAFIQALDLRNIVGVGHSMGGHVQVQAAAGLPERFHNLVLLDPVIFDPTLYREIHERMENVAPEDFPTARRKNHWSSWQEMVKRFRNREPFSLWQLEVLEDYCRYGLLPAPEGDPKGNFVLACPPLVEASIYTGNVEFDIYPLLDKLHLPVLVVRAEQRESASNRGADFSKSPTWNKLAAALEKGTDLYLPELSHLIPMQAPERVAKWVSDSAES